MASNGQRFFIYAKDDPYVPEQSAGSYEDAIAGAEDEARDDNFGEGAQVDVYEIIKVAEVRIGGSVVTLVNGFTPPGKPAAKKRKKAKR